MKTLHLSVLAVAVAVLAASPVLAQRGRGGFGGPSQYLNAKSVQEELKLSADDAKKITDEIGKLDRDLKPEERREKTEKILKDNLKEGQIKRLNQIMWQRSGLARSLNSPAVEKALKLDDKQKDKIKTIQDEAAKERQDLGRGNAEKLAELRKKTNEKITDVLTDDQKKEWKKLLGDEFKGEIPMGGRGRRGTTPPTNP